MPSKFVVLIARIQNQVSIMVSATDQTRDRARLLQYHREQIVWGGAVIPGAGTNSKFDFVGATVADLSDPTKWTQTAADNENGRPQTLGNVSPQLLSAIVSHSLKMPACGCVTVNQPSQKQSRNTKSEVGGLFVYPNPANDELYFEYPSNAKATVRLFDVSGRMISETIIANSSKATIDVSKFPTGLYMYQFISGSMNKSGKINIVK